MEMNSDFKIGTVNEAEVKELRRFYDEYFKNRKYSLVSCWQWQYRIDQVNSPLVALKNDEIAAHSGYIPFSLSVFGKKVSSRWYVDFMVAQAFRRKGLGGVLTKRLMLLGGWTFAITGNEKSMGVFRKLKWRENRDSYLIYLPIVPKYLPFISKYLSEFQLTIIGPLITFIYHVNSLRFRKYERSQVIKMELNKDTIRNLQVFDSGIGQIFPIRDLDFWHWRILLSPDFENYSLLNIEDNYVLFKKTELRDAKYSLDILYVDQSLNVRERIGLFKKLYFWSLKEGYVYLRLYTTSSSLKNLLKYTLGGMISRAAFAYHANSCDNISIDSNTFDFQFLDNDFEDL
ncbi:MAG: GNAT family N-acetyltransferase [Bacteroidia bacterium]